MNAVNAARLVVLLQYQAGKATSHLALQKLLFYCHAYHMAFLNKPLFNETVEAWAYGPVVQSVYQKYTGYGSQTITPEDFDISQVAAPQETLRIMSLVLSRYGSFSPMELVNMTHQESPWKEAYSSGQNNIIENDTIKNYYQQFITNGQ
ncbi:MAG: DUF4065 domain-containing protein [Gallionella sp.]|nr:DUF4065 domain-containing protein [Gallionella sp.]